MNTASVTKLFACQPLLVVAALVATALLYLPGLSGGFIFDDEVNIVKNEKLHIQSLDSNSLRDATLSGTAGPLKRPISMLSFALNHFFTGLDPVAFKAVNLLIHLLNGIAVYLVCLLTLRAYRLLHGRDITASAVKTIALLTATAWLLHPLNVTSVLYVVQRMNSLSALFTLLGLATYLHLRLKLLDGKRGLPLLVASSLLFTVAGALCKENGLLLPGFMLIFEAFLFRFKTREASTNRYLKLFFLLSVALPAIIAVIFLLTNTQWLLAGYEHREFSFTERLLTEARILWFYLSQILLPMNSQLGLFHDDIVVSTSLTNPFTTLPALTGIAMMTLSIYVFRHKAPLISLGLAFFLAGHSMESSIIALELVHEHRNYLPALGILLPLFFYLNHATGKLMTVRTAGLVSTLFIALFSATTLLRTMDWGNPGRLYLMEVAHHPGSSRAHYQLGLTYMNIAEANPAIEDKYTNKANPHFITATELRPEFTDGLFALIQTENLSNQAISQQKIDELTYRLETFPYHANNLNWINLFTSCTPTPGCHPPNAILQRIFSASLSNPTTTGVKRAEIYSMASKYSLEELGDTRRALQLIVAARDAAPNDPRYELHLSTLLAILGQTEKAHTRLKQAEKLDTIGRYKVRIQQLRNQITLASELAQRP